MIRIREVNAAGRLVKVRELTVGEIRAWLRDLENVETVDLVDGGLFDAFSLSDVGRVTDLSAEEIDGMTPSEIEAVVEAAREVNENFFALRSRLAEVGRQMAANSSGPSPV